MSWQHDDNLDLFGDVATAQKHDHTQKPMTTMATMVNADNHGHSSAAMTTKTPVPP